MQMAQLSFFIRADRAELTEWTDEAAENGGKLTRQQYRKKHPHPVPSSRGEGKGVRVLARMHCQFTRAWRAITMTV